MRKSRLGLLQCNVVSLTLRATTSDASSKARNSWRPPESPLNVKEGVTLFHGAVIGGAAVMLSSSGDAPLHYYKCGSLAVAGSSPHSEPARTTSVPDVAKEYGERDRSACTNLFPVARHLGFSWQIRQ